MNKIDFSQPNGFPLEADATLGFMQTAYQDALKGVSQFLGGATGVYVVSGCEELIQGGGVYGVGFISWDGEILPFLGGVNSGGAVVIEEVKVAKQNQNGTLIDRYFTRRVKFGNGIGQVYFSDLKRLNTYYPLSIGVNKALTFDGTEDIVLTGGVYSDPNLSAGFAIIGTKTVAFPVYTDNVFPVYLTPLGVWQTTVPQFGNYIEFTPHTTQRYEDVIRRRSAFIGEIRMMAVNMADFDTTGLGISTLKGWAIANGQNGTFDLRGRFSAGYFDASTIGYDTLGGQGGADSVTLTIDQMPRHNHTSSDNSTGAVASGQLGLQERSFSGQNVTAVIDSTGSGTEPNVIISPQHLPPVGNNEPFDNRPPFTVVLYIQRIA